ncbi:transposase (plasmid) [Providencia sp. R33]|nr:transposase [Providencia sp. R33]
MLKHARRLGLEIGIFCALHTYGRQLNQHPHIYLSVTRGGLTRYDAWKPIFFKKKDVEKVWRSAVIRLLRDSYFQHQPNKLPGFGHIRDYPTWCRYLNAQFQRYWKQYGKSRDFAASTSLVPRQHSTGGRTTLLDTG